VTFEDAPALCAKVLPELASVRAKLIRFMAMVDAGVLSAGTRRERSHRAD
jgi:hypothetical protein